MYFVFSTKQALAILAENHLAARQGASNTLSSLTKPTLKGGRHG